MAEEFIENTKRELEKGSEDHTVLSNELFDSLFFEVLEKIYKELFLEFKTTDIYHESHNKHRNMYNQVHVDDFQYIEPLGQGMCMLC